jgi:hypothetical protein
MAKLRKMLGSIDSPQVIELMKIIPTQNSITLANWNVTYSEKYILPIFLKYYPNDEILKKVLITARELLNSNIIVSQYKSILFKKCNDLAISLKNETIPQACARAIGQASGTIFNPTHSLGFTFYAAAVVTYEKYGLQCSESEYDKFANIALQNMLDELKKLIVKNEHNPTNLKWNC